MCSLVTVDATHERALEHPTRPLSSLWIGEGATSGRGKSRTNWNKLSLAPSDRPQLFSLFLARCEKLARIRACDATSPQLQVSGPSVLLLNKLSRIVRKHA